MEQRQRYGDIFAFTKIALIGCLHYAISIPQLYSAPYDSSLIISYEYLNQYWPGTGLILAHISHTQIIICFLYLSIVKSCNIDKSIRILIMTSLILPQYRLIIVYSNGTSAAMPEVAQSTAAENYRKYFKKKVFFFVVAFLVK